MSISSSEHIARYAGCTVIVGHIQEAARASRACAGSTTSKSSRDLVIHLNPNLTSLAALAKLRTVTGTVGVYGNDVLPEVEVAAFVARPRAKP